MNIIFRMAQIVNRKIACNKIQHIYLGVQKILKLINIIDYSILCQWSHWAHW